MPPEPAPSESVPIRAPDGTLGTVPRSQVQQAIDAGATPATQGEIDLQQRQAQLAQEYGGQGSIPSTVLAQSMAHAAGFARGATLGLRDPAAVALGGESLRQRLQAYKELYPYQSGEGELGGLAASMLTGAGEAGIVGKALGSGGRALGAAGRGAENITRALAGEGAAGRVLGAAARGGAENLLYGTGSDLSEAALGNHEVTAEKLLAAAPEHFGLGALLGGGLGAVGEFGGATKRAIAQALGGSSEISDALEQRSRDMAWGAGGPTQKMTEAMNRYGPEAGRIIRDEAPGLVGKNTFGEMTREELADAAQAGKKQYAARLDEAIDPIDQIAAKTGEQARAKDVIESLREKVLKPLVNNAQTANRAAAARVSGFLDDMAYITGLTDATGAKIPGAANAPMTFRQMRDFRINADKLWAGSRVNPDFGPMKAVRDVLEDDLVNRAELVAHGAGESFGKGYQEAKRGYQAFKMLEKSTARGVAQDQKNQFLSLTDKGFAGAGAIVGSVLGGPIGAALGGGAAGIASKAFRSRFPFWASEGMGRAAQILRMAEESSKVDKRIAEGVRGYLEAKPGRTAATASAGLFGRGTQRQEAFRRVTEELGRVQQDPGAYAKQAASKMGTMPADAPGVTAAITAALAKITAAVAARMPSTPQHPPSLSGIVAKSTTSDTDIAKFARYLRASSDPLSILDSLKAGTLSQDEVDAVKDNYPNLYKQIQQNVLDEVTGGKKKTTYQQRIVLGRLLEIPTDPTLDAGLIGAAQQVLDKSNQPTPDQRAPAPTGKPTVLASQVSTDTEGS